MVVPDKRKLKRMGVLTGLAIGLHNLPEGLATFVATLSSPSLGGALAIAIALHNIPEGMCVSMPVYYATGSKVKGFLWAFLSGVSEPLGTTCIYIKYDMYISTTLATCIPMYMYVVPLAVNTYCFDIVGVAIVCMANNCTITCNEYSIVLCHRGSKGVIVTVMICWLSMCYSKFLP